MVALTVAEGLDHDDTDVQAAALRFLERHRRRSPSQRNHSLLKEAVARARDHVAASLRGRLDGLAGPAAPSLETPPAAPALDWPAWEARWSSLDPELAAWAGVPQAMAAARDGRLDLTALEFDGTEIPRLDPAAELRPIAELDELVEVCAALLDGPMRIDDLERAFDGISRLCDERPDDFATRIEPLREIARKVLRRDVGPFSGWSAQGDLAGVVLSWIAEAFTPAEAGQVPMGRGGVAVVRRQGQVRVPATATASACSAFCRGVRWLWPCGPAGASRARSSAHRRTPAAGLTLWSWWSGPRLGSRTAAARRMRTGFWPCCGWRRIGAARHFAGLRT